jgi:aspartate/glutamate racemase
LVPDEQGVLDRIIFDELCRGQFTASSKTAYLDIVDRMQARGAPGVILGLHGDTTSDQARGQVRPADA